MRKKFLLGIIFSLFTAITLASCTKAVSLELTSDTMTLTIDQSKKINYTLLNDQKNKGVTFVSDAQTIATVDLEGNVLGVSAGTAKITVKAVANTNEKKELTVTVVKPDPEGVTISGLAATNEISLEQEIQLTAVVTPEKADQAVTWETSDSSTVSVTASGKIKGVKVGNAIITAKSSKDGIKQILEVKVKLPEPNSIIINGKKDIDAGEELELTAVITPNTALQDIVWSTSDYRIATVSNAGVVKGISAGTVTITAASAENLTIKNSVEIKVICEPEEVEITGSKNIEVNNEVTLKAKVYPLAAVQAVDWETSDAEIATVSTLGVVKGLKAGEVTITAKSKVSDLEVSVTFMILKTFHVAESFTGAAGETVTYLNKEYVIGETAFTKIQDAVNAMPENGGVIYLAAGVYADATVIAKSNVEIYGPMKNVNPVTNNDDRGENEAVVKAAITYNAGVKNIILNGIAFDEKGQVSFAGTTGNRNENIHLSHLYWLGTTIIDGSWSMIGAPTNGGDSQAFANNVFIENCYLISVVTRLVRFASVKNFEIAGCYLYTERDGEASNAKTGYDALRLRGTEGVVTVRECTFEGFRNGTFAFANIAADEINLYGNIFRQTDYLSLAGISKAAKINIMYNVFENTYDNNYLNLTFTAAAAKEAEIIFRYNIFAIAEKVATDYNNGASANSPTAIFEYNWFIKEPTTTSIKNNGELPTNNYETREEVQTIIDEYLKK